MAEGKTNGHKVVEDLPKGVKVEEIEIPVPWGHVAGRWWGPRDKQPIIAIHGWQDNAGTFDNLIPILPVTTSVLCIDLPGHGLSSHYPTGMIYYVFWDGLVLLRRIVKHFKWQKISFESVSCFRCGSSLDPVVRCIQPPVELQPPPDTPPKYGNFNLICRKHTCTDGSYELCWRPRPQDYDAARALSVQHLAPLKGCACSSCRVPRSVRLVQDYLERTKDPCCGRNV